MKKNLLVAFVAMFVFTHFAQAQGIAFESDTLKWEKILAKAKAENKIVFVDAYTTWCGPCKSMAKNIFPQKSVGDVFNSRYVNVKIDMEKGEGISIQKKYNVRVYPTYLFVNGDGELVHRSLGSMAAEKFVEVGMAASDPDRQYLSLKKRYDGGEKSLAFLEKMAKAAGDAQDGDMIVKTLKSVIAASNNEASAKTIKLISESLENAPLNDVDKDLFGFILKNKAAFTKELGASAVEYLVEETAYNVATRKFISRQTRTLDEAAAATYLNEQLPKENAERVVGRLGIVKGMLAKDDAATSKAIVTYMDKYGTDRVELLNQWAWNFYETVDDKADLEKALSWSLKAIKLEEDYAFYDTAAALYFKLGKKNEAATMAKKAIAMAKENNQDAQETEELLKKIEAMK